MAETPCIELGEGSYESEQAEHTHPSLMPLMCSCLPLTRKQLHHSPITTVDLSCTFKAAGFISCDTNTCSLELDIPQPSQKSMGFTYLLTRRTVQGEECKHQISCFSRHHSCYSTSLARFLAVDLSGCFSISVPGDDWFLLFLQPFLSPTLSSCWKRLAEYSSLM